MTAQPVEIPTYLTSEQARRAWCFATVLALVAGRSVPIQVVERLTHWIYDGRQSDDARADQ